MSQDNGDNRKPRKRRKPFVTLDKDVLARMDLTPSAKLVYAAIVGRMNGEGKAWPGYRKIAADVGIHTDTVKRDVEQLCGLKLLTRSKGSRGGFVYECPQNADSECPQNTDSEAAQNTDSEGNDCPQNAPDCPQNAQAAPAEYGQNKNQEEDPLIRSNDGAAVSLLVERGIGNRVAKRLVATVGGLDETRAYIRWADDQKRNGGFTKNEAAFLTAVMRDREPVPTRFQRTGKYADVGETIGVDPEEEGTEQE